MDFNVRTFTVNEHQLFNIPDMVTDIEKTFRDVKEAGVMKIQLETSIKGQGTPLETFSNFDERLQQAQRQYVVGISHCPNMYGCRSYRPDERDGDECEHPCSEEDVAEFVNSSRDARNHNPSKCSIGVEVESDEDMVNKFFTEVLPQKACTVTQPSKKSVLKRGKKDAASLKKFTRGFFTLPIAQRQEMINSSLKSDARETAYQCSCPGCFMDDVLVDHAKGVMYGSGIDVTAKDEIRISKHFGLYCLASTSLIRFLPHHYPGITTPFLYFGGPNSFFPAHIEDYSMYSFNYLHFGEDKTWIAVPPSGARKLHWALALQTPNINHSTCENLLGHKYFIITPQWLEERGIPFKVVVQKAGEGVIVCPNTVHFGFNKGFNIAEACNFVTESWIPYGIVAPKCRCIGTEAHLDLERIVAAIRPDLIDNYWNQTIPHISKEEDPYFYDFILKSNSEYSPSLTVRDHKIDNDEHIEQGNDEEDEEDEVLPVLPTTQQGRRLLPCPKPSCTRQYHQAKKQRMIAHVAKCHSKDPNIIKCQELLQELFQPRNKTKKITCNLCGKEVAGRAAQMKRHQRSSKCNNRN
ncbi:hypothetical protein ONE63_006700 [Megalurothrips usitatus]|uniref:JmjC domain-containing protein n=1 Tax=Megalurothrips usitatus TaxID=439358 RepID=A0AAV7XU75_9NEOP|nr:hypothetical protein ONE63_006700 [Megalurothrips usitatus]